jgi:hypothetical protein
MAVGGYIEGSGDVPYIECGPNTTTAGKIYTTRPVFISMPEYEGRTSYEPYPLLFDWEIANNGDIVVTIR